MTSKSSLRCSNCGYYGTGRLTERCLQCDRGVLVHARDYVMVTAPEQPCMTCGLLATMLVPGLGWLRIVPHASGELSAKWRFTSGPYEGRYIFWRSTKYEGLSSTVSGLSQKLDDVHAGRLKPSLDDRIY